MNNKPAANATIQHTLSTKPKKQEKRRQVDFKY